jgi:hypothetical protein
VPLTVGDSTISLSTITLSNGQVATFSLSGVASTTPAGTELLRYFGKNVKLASMFSSGPAGAVSILLAGLISLAILAASGKLRRRQLIAFAVSAVVMAATVAGCGNSGSTSSSDQQAVSFSATAGSGNTITASGLPANMGTITLGNSGSSSTVIGPTASPIGPTASPTSD